MIKDLVKGELVHTIEGLVLRDSIERVVSSSFDINWVHNAEIMARLNVPRGKVPNIKYAERCKEPVVPAVWSESMAISELLTEKPDFVSESYKLVSLESLFDSPISANLPFKVDFYVGYETKQDKSKQDYTAINVVAVFMGPKKINDLDMRDDRSKEYGKVRFVFSNERADNVKSYLFEPYFDENGITSVSQSLTQVNIDTFFEGVGTKLSEDSISYKNSLYTLALSSAFILDVSERYPLIHPSLALLHPEDVSAPENAGIVPVYGTRELSIMPKLFDIEVGEPVVAYLTSKYNIAKHNPPHLDIFPVVEVGLAVFQNNQLLYHLNTDIVRVQKALAAQQFMNRID